MVVPVTPYDGLALVLYRQSKKAGARRDAKTFQLDSPTESRASRERSNG
jgi:hypothetical protein